MSRDRAGAPPREFRRILGLAFGGAIAVIFGLILAVTLVNGRLPPWSYKFWYLVILTTLGLAAIACTLARRYGIAYAIVLFVVLDGSFALATQALSKKGIGRSFMPGNTWKSRFMWHPTLQAVPRPGFRDRNYAHDEKGRRRSTPVNPSRPTVLALGGSTTYDLGVKNGETWPEQLELLLAGRANVLNYGVPGYSSAEHVIQAAFYVPREPGTRCAVYYVGWNDIRSSFLPDLDPGYANFHLPSQVDNVNARRTSVLGVVALGGLLDRMLHLAFDTIPVAPGYPKELARSGVDERLLRIYLDNMQRVATLNREAGITPIFVTQVLNAPKLAGDGFYGWFPLVRDRDVAAIQQRFNAALAELGNRKGIRVLNPDWKLFEDADFVDNGHFSARGSRKFAGVLAEPVSRLCLAPGS